MIKRCLAIIFYVLIGILIYLCRHDILICLQNLDSYPLSFTISISTVFALFEVIPFPVIGGILGASHGVYVGGMITWISSTLASIIMFIFTRFIFQSWGLSLISRYRRLHKMTLLFEQNAFLAILILRLIPFAPSMIVNAYSAISRVTVKTYVLATAIGKIPAMFLIAGLGQSFVSINKEVLIILIINIVIIVGTVVFYNYWSKHDSFAKSKN